MSAPRHAATSQSWTLLMQAELHGQIRPPFEAWEDTLTDAVVSALSWLPRRRLLSAFLQRAGLKAFDGDVLDGAEFHFWPRLAEAEGGTCEPDVVILVGDVACVIEAKVGAGFSGSAERGTHQLLREARAVHRRWPGRRVHLVALTRHYAEPEDMSGLRELLAEDGALSWMSWSDIGRLLDPASLELSAHERALAQDVRSFMEKRGVLSMFPGFDPDEYQRVVDATVLAAERIHPQLAQVADELREHFDRERWTWRVDIGARSFGWWGPSDWRRPERWGRTYMALLWWPASWPKDPKQYSGLVGVVFSFLEPKVDVMMSMTYPTDAAEELAATVRRLSDDVEVAPLTGSDWGDPSIPIAAGAVDSAWLLENTTTARFRVRRRMEVTAVTSAGDLANQLERFVGELEAAGMADFIRDHAEVEQAQASVQSDGVET